MSVGPVFTDKVTVVPADWANTVTGLVYGVFNEAATVVDARNALQLGTMAVQNFNSVGITGGTIDGVVIGAVAPQAGRFTNASVTYLNPTLPQHLTSKQYVDGVIANVVNGILVGQITPALLSGKVNKSGDVMTGELILYGDPVDALGAATKQYVDNVTGGLSTLQTNLANATDPTKGAAMVGFYNGQTVAGALNTLNLELLATRPANVFYAGPASGISTVPSWRSLVVADLSFAGHANGVAQLDASGYVPLAQINPSLVGGVNYQGVWNAQTNTPPLASGVGTKGWMYSVSVAGTTALDGITQWNVGDHAVFNGTVWEKIDGVAAEVTSVAGRTGDVVLTYTDIGGLANVAHSGSFTDLSNVPKATVSSLGLVQVGANLSVDVNGVLSANAAPYVLPAATTSTLGGVIIGNGLTVSGGIISVAGGSAVNAVNNEGTGTGLVDNNGITGGIATIKSLMGGPGVTIVANADGKTLTINAQSAVTSVNGNTGDVVVNAANLPNLAVVGRTGSYLDLLNVPNVFNPPIATASVLGGIKVGSGLGVAGDGTLSVTASVAPATTTTIGGVIVPTGNGLSVDGSGNLKVTAATNSALGGVIVGNGLTISTGTIGLGVASASQLGGVKVGSGLSVAGDGTISVNAGGATVSSLNGLTGAVVLTAGSNVVLTPSGQNLQIAISNVVAEAPNDGNAYARQNLSWVVIPSAASAITSITSDTTAGSISILEASPPANSAVTKSLTAGANVTFTDNGSNIVIAASIPAGTVSAINHVTPDGTGNVTLTAASLNALPTAGGNMSGGINMESNTLTGLPTPVNPSDAVPLSFLTGITAIDAGTF